LNEKNRMRMVPRELKGPLKKPKNLRANIYRPKINLKNINS